MGNDSTIPGSPISAFYEKPPDPIDAAGLSIAL